jgi:hypothetical protein
MARNKSLHGNTFAYIFAHKRGFAQAHPQASETMSSDLLRQFATDWRIQQMLIVDGATEQVGQNTEFINRYCTKDTDLHISSPGQPTEKPAEGII